MIVVQWLPEEGRPAAWGIGADGAGQQVEAGLIDPHDGSAFVLRPFFRHGLRSDRHVSIVASLRWVARWIGFWTLQPAAHKRLPT